TISPICLLLISETPLLRKSFSTLTAMVSICSSGTGRFSHALIKPRTSFSRLNSCLAPSFLTTINGTSSMRSNVVKRQPHRSHSLRRRIDRPSSIGLESSTLVFLLPQFEPLNLLNPTLVDRFSGVLYLY